MGKLVGLLVDEVADILTIECEDIDPPPSNVGTVEGKFFQGVYTMGKGKSSSSSMLTPLSTRSDCYV